MVSSPKIDSQTHQCFLDRLVGGALALAAFGLYLATLAPTVLEADGGEFQFVPWLPGIAHPTGYPLYILLGWLWTHLLPFGEVAWRMNLLSAVLAAAVVGFTYAVARQVVDITFADTPWKARVVAAAIAAATFAVSQTFWSQAIIAEVYTLHTLFVVVILWLATSSTQRKIRGKWLAFTIGLSLTHHSTIVLLLPALVLFLWYNASRRDPVGDCYNKVSTPKNGNQSPVGGGRRLTYIALLAVPLLLYLYLPLIAPFTPYTRLKLSETQTLTLYDNSPLGFLNHVMARVFTGELKPTAAGWDRLQFVWQLLRQQFGWVGVSLAISGLISLWLRRQMGLLLLTGLGSLGFVAFNLIYFIGDVFVLFIPVWLFVSLWLGLGCLGAAHWLARSFAQSKVGPANTNLAFGSMEQRLGQQIYHFITFALITPGAILPLVLLGSNYNGVEQSQNFVAREHWQRVLNEPIPTGAVLLSNDRNEMMPMWYYQYVEGRRPDLLGLFPLIAADPAYANVGRVLDKALASKRPVYLIKPMAGLEIKANLTPVGTLFQAIGYSTPPSRLLDVILPPVTLSQTITETIKLGGYDLSSAKIRPVAPLTATLYWQATQPLSVDYTSFIHLVNSDGQDVTQSDHRPGGDFYPSHYWQVGETLRDRHTLTISSNLPPGTYRLRVGMYYQPEPGVIVGMGNGVEIGSVIIQP